MSELAKYIGQRIRNYRTNAGYSQEKLAELCGCHPTYIGQIERGEKNATVDSIGKIAQALNIPLSTLFEKLDDGTEAENIPLKCYELLSSKSLKEQKLMYQMLMDMEKYIENKT